MKNAYLTFFTNLSSIPEQSNVLTQFNTHEDLFSSINTISNSIINQINKALGAYEEPVLETTSIEIISKPNLATKFSIANYKIDLYYEIKITLDI